MEWRVKTPDGRTVAVEDVGDRAGRPVLVHVGTPNSRHLYGLTVADAAARGLRLISYDRPASTTTKATACAASTSAKSTPGLPSALRNQAGMPRPA
jgi:hypothetical protein